MMREKQPDFNGGLMFCPHCGVPSTLRKDVSGLFFLEKIKEIRVEEEKIKQKAREFAKQAKEGLRDLIEDNTKTKSCPDCKGLGWVQQWYMPFMRFHRIPTFRGCQRCKGTGVIRE